MTDHAIHTILLHFPKAVLSENFDDLRFPNTNFFDGPFNYIQRWKGDDAKEFCNKLAKQKRILYSFYVKPSSGSGLYVGYTSCSKRTAAEGCIFWFCNCMLVMSLLGIFFIISVFVLIHK